MYVAENDADARDAVEHAREDPIVGVEEGLALHETGAAEVVEAQRAGAVQTERERLEEGEPLLHADRHALVAQPVEEIEEHAPGRGSYWL